MAQPLSTRRLGAGGPEITTVGFGAWAIEAAIGKTGAGAGPALPRKA